LSSEFIVRSFPEKKNRLKTGEQEAIEVTIKIPRFIERPLVWILLACRRLRYGYAFRRIRLNNGMYAIVDPEDYEWLPKDRWTCYKKGRTYYTIRHFSKKEGINKKSTSMHRLVMTAPDGVLVDHINHNGLDNRKANLRFATLEQNAQNQRKTRSKTSSRFKGVNKTRNPKIWQARIYHNKRAINLGHFRDEAEAAKAYDRAARKYQGEYAQPNFPQAKR
jgi:hypothetical protein